MDLELSSYHYDLPDELIAQRPAEPRDHSRLLIYDEHNDQIIDDHFFNLSKYLPSTSTMVFNNSKVFACRIKAEKSTGAKSEIFLLENDPELIDGDKCYLALLRSSSKKKVEDRFKFNGHNGQTYWAQIKKCLDDGTFYLTFSIAIDEVINQSASIPIPPYIRKGISDERDLLDYQTVYAKESGSVAAPTAGLHFSDQVFSDLSANGIDRAQVTLHVGMGTFSPVKSQNILEHKMHSEKYFVENEDLIKIKQAKKLVAVGTTSLRVLESLWPTRHAYEAGTLKNTNIFLHPGIDVLSISALVTNFHLPGSSLLMLVSAIIGRKKTMQIYDHAVAQKYRFFSYGDAMLILRKDQ